MAGNPPPLSPPASVVRGDWPLVRRDLRRDGAATGSGSSILALAWSYFMGAAILSSPAVRAGVVYIASTNGLLAALAAPSRPIPWPFRAWGQLYSTPSSQSVDLSIGA